MDHLWGISTIDVEGYHHIQSQEGEICQILFCQGFSLKVSMDEAKSSQTEDSCSITREVWDCNSSLISHHNEFNGSPTAYQNTDLASNFI
jgi:hypothetical protein